MIPICCHRTSMGRLSLSSADFSCRRGLPFAAEAPRLRSRTSLLQQQKPTFWLSSRRNKLAVTAAAAAAVNAAAAESPAPNEERYSFIRTVAPTALALLVCNMDRICLSVAMVPLAGELGWGETVQGLVQSAFLWGYLANQLLGGTLADKFGGKAVMAAGITFFSLASALLPAVAATPFTAAMGITLPAVLAVRFLVGFGEGVALPSMNNLVATRIPKERRATALGFVFMGFQLGNLVGLALSPLIVQHFGWRALFYCFGLLGAPLLLLWNAVVPPPPRQVPPAEKASANLATEAAKQPGTAAATTSFGAMLRNKAVWAIIVANFVNHWGYFMYLNWMPTFFYKVFGMNLRASSLMSFLPWLVMALGSSASGLLSDALVRSGVDPTKVRKAVQTIAFLGPVVPLLVLAGTIGGELTPTVAVTAMTLALGITSLGQFVTNMSDVAPRQAGRLFGLCNTFGSLAGILGVSVAGFLVETTGSFGLVFQITAAMNIVGTIVWNVFCSAEKQFE